jgi:hypothetical protein
MATGPEHYQKAEELLLNAGQQEAGSETERYQLAAAQVHATLALAAAVGLNDSECGKPADDHKTWLDVASVTK